MTSPASLRVSLFVVGTLTVLAPRAVHAQPPIGERKWAIELYGGGSVSSESSKGTSISGFPAGTPFTAQSGRPSRAVSSWYFGDGSVLLNQVLAQFAASTGSPFERIVPLDNALMANGASRGNAGAFGLRIGRAFSQRLAFELNVERGLAPLGLSGALNDAIEETSASFEAAFLGLLSTAPVTFLTVDSTVTMRNSSNAQTRIGGALTYTFLNGDRIDAYVTGGGGVVMNSGDSPDAVLNGNYTFRLFGAFPMNETDRVVVRVEQPKTSPMGLVGGGVTYDLSSRVGIRFDARLMLNSTKTTTTVSGSPGVIVAAPTNVLPSAGSPAIQFSTLAGVRSTLSGEPTKLTTFTGSGLSRQVAITVGIFRRF